MKMKHIPNMLTIARILLTLSLVLSRFFPNAFPAMGILSFTIYCVAGFTDMIDGPLARRIKDGKSKIGTELDSFADMLLVIIAIFFLLPAMIDGGAWGWFWPVILIALAFKIISASLSGLIKHGSVQFTHTVANKFLAFLLFSSPIMYFIFYRSMGRVPLAVNLYITFAIGFVFIATIEEALINLMLKKPNPNIRGIWKVKEANRDQA